MTRIAEVGRNCWRLARASRAAALVDAAAYFEAVSGAIERARRSIVIVGWDVHSRTWLDRRRPRAEGELAAVLDAATKATPGLRVHVLAWDFAPLFALEREFAPLVQFNWKTGRRVDFRLASDHPTGACHHQKIVVVDDRLAFVGGLDLTVARWDEPAHAPRDDRRRLPNGELYDPFHDVQLAVDGEAAVALGELARERWHRATGRRLSAPDADGDPWPPDLTPRFRDVDVLLARTEPGFDGRPPVREVETLFLDSIAAARKTIYIENQYLTSTNVCRALAARLEAADGPEVFIVTPGKQLGPLEQLTMGILRGRFVRRLRAADRHGRLRIVCPFVGDVAVNVHSKVMIVDDCFARIGSANISNRSMGLDTECDAAIEAADEPTREAIVGLRRDLLAEHLGAAPQDVEAAIARAGSLAVAAESLRRGDRVLREVEIPDAETVAELAPSARLADSDVPIEEALVRHSLSAGAASEGRRRLPRLFAAGAMALVVAALWGWATISGGWPGPVELARMMAPWRSSPFAPVLAILGFALATLLMAPVTAATVAVTLAFGAVEGIVVSYVGSLLSATIAYGLGLLLWRDTVRALAGKRLNGLSRRLARRGILAVVAVRMIPVAPFTIVNLVAGSSHVGYRDFLLGSALGMAPGVVVIALASEGVADAIRDPSAGTFAFAVGAVLALFAGLALVSRLLKQKETARERR